MSTIVFIAFIFQTKCFYEWIFYMIRFVFYVNVSNKVLLLKLFNLNMCYINLWDEISAFTFNLVICFGYLDTEPNAKVHDYEMYRMESSHGLLGHLMLIKHSSDLSPKDIL